MSAVIPGHVLAAFQVEGNGEPAGVAWDNGLRFGRVVIAPASPAAAWSGKAREKIAAACEGFRVARPVRATDGRLVVGGYAANEFADGAPAARVDEAVAAALRFDDAVRGLEPPAQTGGTEDAWAETDRAVWAGETWPGERVVAHVDFLQSCLFDQASPPVLTGVSPSVELRPRGYTAAVVIVDGLLAGAVDERVLTRWAHVPNLPELAAKALEFRERGPQATAPQSNVSAIFERVRNLVSA